MQSNQAADREWRFEMATKIKRLLGIKFLNESVPECATWGLSKDLLDYRDDVIFYLLCLAERITTSHRTIEEMHALTLRAVEDCKLLSASEYITPQDLKQARMLDIMDGAYVNGFACDQSMPDQEIAIPADLQDADEALLYKLCWRRGEAAFKGPSGGEHQERSRDEGNRGDSTTEQPSQQVDEEGLGKDLVDAEEEDENLGEEGMRDHVEQSATGGAIAVADEAVLSQSRQESSTPASKPAASPSAPHCKHPPPPDFTGRKATSSGEAQSNADTGAHDKGKDKDKADGIRADNLEPEMSRKAEEDATSLESQLSVHEPHGLQTANAPQSLETAGGHVLDDGPANDSATPSAKTPDTPIEIEPGKVNDKLQSSPVSPSPRTMPPSSKRGHAEMAGEAEDVGSQKRTCHKVTVEEVQDEEA